MRLKNIFLIIILVGGILVLSSCNSVEKSDKNTDSTYTYNAETKKDLLNKKSAYDLLDNDILFTYNSNTNLTIESFNDITTVSNLIGKHGADAIRENNDSFYTVYSLKEKKLAYVVFWYGPESGIGFAIEDILVYPTDNVEDELPFLLEKDLPQNILK